VDGVLTCDPRKVKKAFTLPTLSYSEAMEMSHFGAKVIYPPTIQPAFKKNIPIYIKNTFNPDFIGTLITNEVNHENDKVIKGITSLNNIALLRLQGSGIIGVPGVSARLFGALGVGKINVILITQASSEHSICIAVSEKEADSAKENIDAEFKKEIDEGQIDPVMIEKNLSVIAVVGEMMRNTPGVAGKLFGALGSNGINVIAVAQGSSELNISFVINKKDELKALNLIHDSFFLSDNRRIHLFIAGVGLIGGTLLDQIEKQRQHLIDQYKIEINVAGLSNSKKMLINENGIDLTDWKDNLQNSETIADLNTFVDTMIKENLSNTIFIDNTANEDVSKVYAKVLENSISVVTSNKVATSGDIFVYNKLKHLASQKNVQFRYETNVGAGLPLISTLQNLIASGDTILKIEAVMSGSVSYIFNNFTADKNFSELVLDAREKGFTEPDPREDLSGADVRRKVVILARESGNKISAHDVVLESVLPDELMKIPTVEEFLKELPKYDTYFNEMNQKALNEGKVLRYIASTDKQLSSVKVVAVDPSNPFYSLQGSDNMFVITTQRYHIRPIIIRGPGAGAEVTAAGVFADVLSIVN
jgi:aspartokinase/homoserine dehydrogenase 1